ncbi:potassium voltage-gated channel subfamily a member [Plakobranchus ocellatus]|uniref:Potassium voltage-gated channel subfamily a member n=1 Tax=Plakobranchus ocellatus TaxID=259542 RepID=A0AAV3YJ91_9GAST|nr:potassium voltage-gated channel subfamily a member [Plakobranchus ocellatus]
MTQYLPPNLLALFAARDPLPFLPPADKLPHEKKRAAYLGVAEFLNGFEPIRQDIDEEVDFGRWRLPMRAPDIAGPPHGATSSHGYSCMRIALLPHHREGTGAQHNSALCLDNICRRWH